MLYSSIPHNIRRHDLTRHAYFVLPALPIFVLGMPLFFNVPEANGAVTIQPIANSTHLFYAPQSTFDTDTDVIDNNTITPYPLSATASGLNVPNSMNTPRLNVNNIDSFDTDAPKVKSIADQKTLQPALSITTPVTTETPAITSSQVEPKPALKAQDNLQKLTQFYRTTNFASSHTATNNTAATNNVTIKQPLANPHVSNTHSNDHTSLPIPNLTVTPVTQAEDRLADTVLIPDNQISAPPTTRKPDAQTKLTQSADYLVPDNKIVNANRLGAVAAPELFNTVGQRSSSHRCEGVWITPNNTEGHSDYAHAIAKAESQGQFTTSEGLPLYAQADYAYFDSETTVELAGNVEIIQAGQIVTAEQINLDLASGIAGVQGNVLLAQTPTAPNDEPQVLPNSPSNAAELKNSGLILLADDLAYDTNTPAATAHDVAFASVPLQAHGYARRLNKPDDTHYELDQVMFSTCPPTDRKWQIEADQIDINTESGRGEAYSAMFRLGNVPVFYLPYFNFPVDNRRSSGVLTPSASIDSNSGLKISVPYYLNLAPNFDATLNTDVYTSRNPMLTAELRYLTQDYGQGALTTAYLPKDKQYADKNRRGFFYQHQWQSEATPKLSANIVYNYVSDPEYLNDFDDFGVTDNRLNLPRRAEVNFYNNYVNTQLKFETFQSLNATDAQGNVIQDKDKPYSRLPQLKIDYSLPKLNNYLTGYGLENTFLADSVLNNVLISGVHSSAYFKKSITDGSENEKSGVRIYNKIDASYPVEKTWGYVIPKISLQHLYAAYDEESRIVNAVSKEDNTQTAFVPHFSVDTGLNFYQAGSPFGFFDQSLGGYRLLSPRLKYDYAPYDDQTKIPNFNTRIASVNYNQLFADSWFLGYDRLPDKNNVTLGMNYRYIDAMGVTRFDGSIGDQFFLDGTEVTLETGKTVFNDNNSGVAWASTVHPYRNIWFDFNGALSSDNHLNFLNGQIRYQPTPLSLINLGYIKRESDTNTNQQALSALTASAVVPISQNWRFMAQGQFDNDNSKFIDSTIGVEYEDCCYGFSIYGRSHYNDLNLENSATRAIMAEFRINGLGDRNSRFRKIFNEKVLGFEPIDTLWQK